MKLGPFDRKYRLLAVLLAATLTAVCDQRSPVDPDPPGCSYALSSMSLSFGASGGTGSVSVMTGSGCQWTAVSDRSWMSITSGGSGTGNGAVQVSLAPNTGEDRRTGTLSIAGHSVAVQEDGLGACTVDVSPGSAAVGAAPATGSFAISTAGHCQWTAVSTAPWIAVISGSTGSGNGSVGYAVGENNSVDERKGGIEVGGRTFAISQSGEKPGPGACEYSVTPITFTPCMSVSASLTAAITTQQGCSWTATAGAPWITISGGQSGVGSGTVSFTVADNWEGPRHDVVMVRWPAVTAGQNLQVAQAGCYYAVSTTAISIPGAGGTGRFDVLQQSDPNTCGGPLQNACRWTADTNVPWITVTTSMPQAGDNPVAFSVAANPDAAPRTGTIRVRDKVVQVTQAGR